MLLGQQTLSGNHVTLNHGRQTPVFMQSPSQPVVKTEVEQDVSATKMMAPPSPRPGPIPKPFKCDVCNKGFTDQVCYWKSPSLLILFT